jgi:hypothetical protein
MWSIAAFFEEPNGFERLARAANRGSIRMTKRTERGCGFDSEANDQP